MSDESSAPKPSAQIEAPLTSWVKGGTSTSIHEQALKKKRAEAEQRRKEEAARQQIATQDPVGARRNTMSLGGHRGHAVVVLEFRNSDGKADEWIVCELSVGREDPTSLTLVMCCPFCARKHGMDEAQFHTSNKHRKFELDTRRAGELWVNPKDPREHYTIAGTIFTQESIPCPTCTWRFQIDNSVLKTIS
jgi:hypothetical protein